jgi:F-type H+-transporting ATPase subunit gamma
MANLKEIRNRITSVSSTKQITSAMKMVSAAKLKRAQDAVVQMRPYANKLEEILRNVSATLDESQDSVYSTEREVRNVLIVAISSNRGLCGGFNSAVIKRTNALIEKYQDKTITVLSIGKKADDFFSKTEYNIKGSKFARNYNGIFDNLEFETVAELAQNIMDAFAGRQFDKVELVYNQFKNAAVQVLTVEQMLPVAPPEPKEGKADTKVEYIFEPSKEFIVKELIPKQLKLQLFKAILDSRAAEHGARMTAMHKATDNATELIKELKLSYNKARQASITNEILEIVAGAEALSA